VNLVGEGVERRVRSWRAWNGRGVVCFLLSFAYFFCSVHWVLLKTRHRTIGLDQ